MDQLIPYLENNFRLPRPIILSKEIYAKFCLLWHEDVEFRPTFKEVINWFDPNSRDSIVKGIDRKVTLESAKVCHLQTCLEYSLDSSTSASYHEVGQSFIVKLPKSDKVKDQKFWSTEEQSASPKRAEYTSEYESPFATRVNQDETCSSSEDVYERPQTRRRELEMSVYNSLN